ncbi:hypothetical protein HZA73_01280 [candidate division TA06 bacterium]|nr:hypothetical protein [candidate division TA06 bacterium]
MPDYLPRPDSVFDRWVADFIEYSTQHRSELGLTDSEAAELQKARNAWSQAFVRHRSAQEAARLATEDKEQKRAEVEQAVRKYVRVIQARPATTNKQRRGLGISLKPEDRQESAATGAAVSISEISLAGY